MVFCSIYNFAIIKGGGIEVIRGARFQIGKKGSRDGSVRVKELPTAGFSLPTSVPRVETWG